MITFAPHQLEFMTLFIAVLLLILFIFRYTKPSVSLDASSLSFLALSDGCIKYTISGWELLITFFVFNKCSTWAQHIALLPFDIYIAFKWSLLSWKETWNTGCIQRPRPSICQVKITFQPSGTNVVMPWPTEFLAETQFVIAYGLTPTLWL